MDRQCAPEGAEMPQDHQAELTNGGGADLCFAQSRVRISGEAAVEDVPLAETAERPSQERGLRDLRFVSRDRAGGAGAASRLREEHLAEVEFV